MQTRQDIFNALADPTRRWVIERLSQVESDTSSHIAEQLPISRQAVSKHFNVLVAAGLVHSRQIGRERHYSLNPEPLQVANNWIDEISNQWDRRLLRLKAYLSDEKGEKNE